MHSGSSSKADATLKSRLPPILCLVLVVGSATTVLAYLSSRNLLLTVVPLLAVTVLSFALIVFPDQHNRDVILQLVIGVFGLSLLLSSTVISNNLLGWDVHQEFNLSLGVLRSGVWHPEIQSQYNSVLSITILPAMISSVSNVDLIWIFKVIFPVLFSLVPVVLYRVYRSVLGPEASFLCSFLFASYPDFYLELISLARQEVATLLLVLALFIFFCPSIDKGTRGKILTLLITIGIVTSHYSIAYIYLALLALSFVLSKVSKSSSPLVRAPILLFAGVITMSWYSLFVSPFELTSLGQLFSWLANGILFDFLTPGSRPAILSMALSQYRPGLLGGFNRALYYAMNLVIVLGFLVFIRKRRKTTAEGRVYSLLVLAFVLLGFSVLLPYFAASLDIQRIYLLVLLFASPCFVLGMEAFGRLLGRLKLSSHGVLTHRTTIHLKWIPAVTILLCYFMFTSGWVWAVTMTAPSSFILDSTRMRSYPDDSVKAYFFSYYTAPQDIAGARWLKQYATTDRVVCADWNSRLNVLTSYGGLSRGLSNGPMLPSSCDFPRAYVYLSLLNTVYGVGTQGNWSVSMLPIGTLNRVYSDASTIYT